MGVQPLVNQSARIYTLAWGEEKSLDFPFADDSKRLGRDLTVRRFPSRFRFNRRVKLAACG